MSKVMPTYVKLSYH